MRKLAIAQLILGLIICLMWIIFCAFMAFNDQPIAGWLGLVLFIWIGLYVGTELYHWITDIKL